MNILFLTENFPPESNAPAIRTHEHAKLWQASDPSVRVTVLTGAPNHPRGRVYPGYRNRLWQREQVDGIEVVRVWTYPAPNRGVLRRSLDYLSYLVSATLGSLFLPRPDVVVATSPQLLTAVAGWLVSLRMRRPLILEIRDLWPESISAVGAMRQGLLLRTLAGVARFLYRRARLVVPVTQAFAAKLEDLGVDRDRLAVVPNGIDADALPDLESRASVRARLGIPPDAFVAAYVGTLGMAQGLGTLLDTARLARNDAGMRFVVVGDGADREELLHRIGSERLDNVLFLERRARPEALSILAASDVSTVLLRDRPVFETVLPSKIFEAMALGVPIALGVRGEARRVVVDECRAGVAIAPEDPEALLAALRSLRADPARHATVAQAGPVAVARSYSRRVLAARLLESISTAIGRRLATSGAPSSEPVVALSPRFPAGPRAATTSAPRKVQPRTPARSGASDG